MIHKVTIILNSNGQPKELYLDDKAIYAMKASVDWVIGEITQVSFTVPTIDVEFITDDE